MSKCLITGCRLVVPHGFEQRSLWGDLHRVGDIYVFNGNTKLNRMAAWEFTFPGWTSRSEKQIRLIDEDADWFERRGIVTIAVGDVEFNRMAREFIDKWGA